jgi:mRNA interferase RelE/StbE
MYRIEWTKKAQKNLKKLDKTIARKIKDKVKNDLAKDPYNEGEPLKGNLKGKWSFHYASYRVIYEIWEKKLLIIVVEVGHRRDIYD